MNALYVATAGSATSRPTPVATSASAMPAITACVPCSVLPREVVERADDAEHGAEQADERRVVAERAEEREPLLVAQALVLERARPCAPRRTRRPSPACARQARATAASIERAPSSSFASAAAGPLVAQRARARRRAARAAARSWMKNQIRSIITATAASESASSSHSTQREPARSMRSRSWASIVVSSFMSISPVRTGRAGRRSAARSGSSCPALTSSGSSAMLVTST